MSPAPKCLSTGKLSTGSHLEINRTSAEVTCLGLQDESIRRMGPTATIHPSEKREHTHTHTHTLHAGKMAMSRWRPRLGLHCHKPKKATSPGSWKRRKEGFSHAPFRRSMACQHVDFRSCFEAPSLWRLSWGPWETTTQVKLSHCHPLARPHTPAEILSRR